MIEKKSKVITESLKNTQWRKTFHMYYIEPVVMILVFSYALSATILKNQIIFQACTMIFNYNESDCQQLGTSNASDYDNIIETEVQPYAASLLMIKALLGSTGPALCGIFIGSCADYYGRKPILLVSIIGIAFLHVLFAIICALSSYYPVNPWYYIISYIPYSILGGFGVFYVGADCFISDITDRNTRPYRMLFLEASICIAFMGGSFLSTFVYNATNSTTVFAISGILMCCAAIFVALCLPETLHLRVEDTNTEDAANRTDIEKNIDLNIINCEKCAPQSTVDNNNSESKDPQKESIKKSEEESKKIGLFSFGHIKDMFTTFMKPRESYNRCIIWLVTGIMIITSFIEGGTRDILFLFVREKFHWTIRDFTFYETLSYLIYFLCALIGFFMLRKIFHLSVVTLAILPYFSEVVSNIIRGLATESRHLYLAVGLEAFRSISGPMCRTILSNIVPLTDLGKLFSMKNIFQSIAPLLATPFYTFIYKQSLTTFPGLYFLVSAVLYTIAVMFISFVLYIKLKHRDRYSKLLK